MEFSDIFLQKSVMINNQAAQMNEMRDKLIQEYEIGRSDISSLCKDLIDL
jgi:hypothetical protein